MYGDQSAPDARLLRRVRAPLLRRGAAAVANHCRRTSGGRRKENLVISPRGHRAKLQRSKAELGVAHVFLGKLHRKPAATQVLPYAAGRIAAGKGVENQGLPSGQELNEELW